MQDRASGRSRTLLRKSRCRAGSFHALGRLFSGLPQVAIVSWTLLEWVIFDAVPGERPHAVTRKRRDRIGVVGAGRTPLIMPHGDLHCIEVLGSIGVVREYGEGGKLDGVGCRTAILAVRLIPCVHDVRFCGGRRVHPLSVPTLGEAYNHANAAISVGARRRRTLLRVVPPCHITVPQHVPEVPIPLTRDHPEAFGERPDISALLGGEGSQTLVIETGARRLLNRAVDLELGHPIRRMVGGPLT